MTEAEWLGCPEAAGMLGSVFRGPTPRKLRLFACACCRRIWHLMPPAGREAVEVAERYADKEVKDAERRRAQQALSEAMRSSTGDMALKAAGCACARNQDREVFRWVIPNIANAAAHAASGRASRAGYEAERRACPALVRDVWGNPFRPVTLAARWRTPQAVAVATAAYDERQLPAGHLDPSRLLVLADALEEAGCGEEAVLSHLRSAGPHVRGCWAVDLVLGKS